MKRFLQLLYSTATLPGSTTLQAQQRLCPGQLTDVADKKFAPGQVWTYSTRAGEERSTVTVLRVDSLARLGIVVHVRVDGLRVHQPGGELVPTVLHMPFLRDALLGSVEKQIGTAAPVPRLEGVEEWQRECGGAYRLSVRDAVDVMQTTLEKGSAARR